MNKVLRPWFLPGSAVPPPYLSRISPTESVTFVHPSFILRLVQYRGIKNRDNSSCWQQIVCKVVNIHHTSYIHHCSGIVNIFTWHCSKLLEFINSSAVEMLINKE